MRALLATGAGGLLAGSTDAAIRAWMPATLADSYMVAAPPPPPSAAPLTDEVRFVCVCDRLQSAALTSASFILPSSGP